MKKPLVIAGGIVGVLVLAVAAIIVIQLLRSDDPNLATEAPRLSSPTPSEGAATTSSDASPATPTPAATTVSDGVRHFVIVAEESEAKYVVRESLRGIKTNAVGTTSAIEGDIYLTAEGLSDEAVSSFRVDLSTLKSDESMRDNYIKRNTLQTSQYQYAEFVIEEITGFPAGYAGDDSEVEMTISGTLTIRDISMPVTWAVKARQLEDQLSAVADLTITFQDFGMSPPSVPIATAEDEIQLQVVLIAREAS